MDIDIALGLSQELTVIYNTNEVDQILKDMLKSISGLMSDRASVMKSSDKSFSDKRIKHHRHWRGNGISAL